MVDTHDEHGGVILCGAGDDSLLGTSLNVVFTLVLGGEDTSGFTDGVGSSLAPWDSGGILLSEDVNEVSIDLDATFSFLDCALELS